MVTFAQAVGDIDRRIEWRLVLTLPRCTHENGSAPCTATLPCYFTYPTCKDKGNFGLGTRDWVFGGILTEQDGAYPLVDSERLTLLPTKIDSEKFATERGELRVTLRDCEPDVLADASKTTSPVEAGVGTFWARFMARQVWQNATASLYMGFEGVAVADYRRMFRGRIKNIDMGRKSVTLRLYDILDKLGDFKCPIETDSDRKLTVIYNGEVTMTVDSSTDFLAATPAEPRQVIVESDIVQYTGKGVGTLTGCTAGMYGTTSVSHPIGTEVAQCQIYGTADYTDGLPPDHILMDLLCSYAKVPTDFISFEDLGVTLNGGCGAADVAIAVSDNTLLPMQGVGKIGTEVLRWTSKGVGTVAGCVRGLYGTTAAIHNNGDPIYPTTFSTEIDRWMPGIKRRRKLTKPTKVAALVQEMQLCTVMDIWQDEDGTIKGRLQAPPVAAATPPTLSLADLGPGPTVATDDEDRITRAFGYHTPAGADPGKNLDDYTALYITVGVEEETANWFGEAQGKTVYLPWIATLADARTVVDRIFARYRGGLATASFTVELARIDDLMVCGLCYLALPGLVGEDGNPPTKMFRVVAKNIKPRNRIVVDVEDTGFGLTKYAAIGFASPVLDVALNAGVLSVNIDVSASHCPTFADLATAGSFRIITPSASSFEDITYTGKADLGGGVILLTGLTRGCNGTADANHLVGDSVRLNYSAFIPAKQALYGFMGDVDNKVDANADYITDTDGYYIY